MDPRRSSERVGAAHPPNQISDLRPHSGTTASGSTLPRPVAPEPPPVPPHHRLRPHHMQRTPPALPGPGQYDPEDPVQGRQPWPRLACLPHGELLPKREVLQCQLAVRANRGSRCPNEDPKPSDHGRSNSQFSPTNTRKSRPTTFSKHTRFALLEAEPPSRASSMAARQAQGSPEKSRTDHGHRSSLLRRGRWTESERHISPGYPVILSRVAIQIGSKSRTLTRNGVCYRLIAGETPGASEVTIHRGSS
jgi:hypothetical protein